MTPSILSMMGQAKSYVGYTLKSVSGGGGGGGGVGEEEEWEEEEEEEEE